MTDKKKEEQDSEAEAKATIDELEAALEVSSSSEKSANEQTRDSLLGGEVAFAGITLRPVTLSTLAMLEKLKSPLVSGDEQGDMMIEALIFVWIQSEDLDVVRAAILTSDMDSRISIEARALSLGDRLQVNDIQGLVDVVSKMLSESQVNKVEQIPDNDSKKHRAKSKNK